MSASTSSASASTSSSPIPRYIDQGTIELISVIGHGAYGQVYSALDFRYTDACGEPLPRAVKCLRRHGLDSRQRQFQRREIGLHRLATGHPSIIGMSRMLEEGDWIFMVMEYAPEGDLFGMICDKQRYVGDDELIRSVFLQLIDGLAFLHSLGISHRDIKPENLVCSDNGTRVRICDFGLATSERKSDEFGCGSTFYIAPECLGDWNPSQTHYDTQRSDIWSLGIILVNLVCGRNPWRIASTSDESFTSFLADPTFLRRILPISDECLYVLAQIFTIDPNARISLNKLRRAVLGVKSFFMGEDELRAAHSAAQPPVPQHVSAPVDTHTVQQHIDMDFDEEDGDDQWLEHAEYDDDDTVFALDEELGCEPDFGSIDGKTPSLRADSISPRQCFSPATSSTCSSIPGTPIIELEGSMPQPGTNLIFSGMTSAPQCHTQSIKKRHPSNLFDIAAPRVIC